MSDSDNTTFGVVTDVLRWRAWAKFGEFGSWRCLATRDSKAECEEAGKAAIAAETGRSASFVVLPREQQPEDHDGPIERLRGRYGHDCVDA